MVIVIEDIKQITEVIYMLDFNNMLPGSEIKFKFTANSEHLWEALLPDDSSICAKINEETNECTIYSTIGISDSEVMSEFEKFKNNCPIYHVMNIDNVKISDICNKVDIFENILTGTCLLIYGESSGIEYAKRCIEWLRKTDFYIAPASTKYHDSVPEGLLTHTLNVVKAVTQLSKIDNYCNVNLYEAILAAIVHDWCKIEFYEQYTRNVKDESTGKWNKESAYRYKGSCLPFGHGVTSMFIAQKFFKLTTEQALAIRWHMGEYNVCDSEKHDLMDANEKYPMVTLLQMADRLSIM